MTTTNNITGDKIKTKPTTPSYRDNYDLIFGKQPVNNSTEKLKTANNNYK